MIITAAANLDADPHRISGVLIKHLKTFPDDRGFFREVIRSSDPFFDDGSGPGPQAFAQWSHSKMALNTVKAWHYHHRQIDWWYAPIGLLHVALFDKRSESPTFGRKLEFYLGESELNRDAFQAVVRIPQGVLHGCKVLSDTAHLFYVTSQTYNPDDEGRYRFDSPEIPHSWGDPAELIVAPNDRRDFPPTAPRTALAS